MVGRRRAARQDPTRRRPAVEREVAKLVLDYAVCMSRTPAALSDALFAELPARVEPAA